MEFQSQLKEGSELRRERWEEKLTVCEEESRRLGNELNSDENLGERKRRMSSRGRWDERDDGVTHVESHWDLDDVGDPPTPTRGEVARSENDPGRDDASENPVRVLSAKARGWR